MGKTGEADWAIEEFGNADLNDKRLTDRLVQLAGILGEKPQESLPQVAGEAATLKAAYRFFDNEDVTAPRRQLEMDMATIRNAHWE